MKKVLVFCLALVMVTALSLTAFAAPNGFVSSPSATPAPTLTGSTSSDGTSVSLTVLPYSKKDTLSGEALANFETAYNDIVKASALTDVAADLSKVAEEKNVPVKDLAVSDLFDISYDDVAANEGGVSITLKADNLQNFVALLHYTNDQWVVVDNAKVVNDNQELSFSVDSLSPFAIVVNTQASASEKPQEKPQTPAANDDGNSNTADSMLWVYVALIVASVIGLTAVVICTKKKKA